MENKFGSEYKKQDAYVMLSEEGKYKHQFGGSKWKTIDKQTHEEGPVTLLTLDLKDPILNHLSGELDELPLCSYVNSDIWKDRQVYRVDNNLKVVFFEEKHIVDIYDLPTEDKFPIPFPEKKISFRKMLSSEYPSNEKLYWENCDNFLGGNSFIRILGLPLWLEKVEKIICKCGTPMQFVSSIGYEGDDEPYLFFKETPFFLGEGALYFWFCKKCLRVTVISQNS